MSPFQTLSSHIAWACPWYQVRKDEIILPNGQHAHYHTIEKAPSAWVVPVTANGHIALIYTYRYTIDKWSWEIPAGSIKPGQTPLQAAEAELLEEVGGKANEWEEIGRFYTANGICNELGHYFLATGVTLGPPAHEPAEVIQIHTKPIAQALHMAHTGQITDAPTVMALLLCQPKLTHFSAIIR